MNLRDALAAVETSGDIVAAGPGVADIILDAARGLLDLYEDLGLDGVSSYSAADQCADLYDLLGRVGLVVP